MCENVICKMLAFLSRGIGVYIFINDDLYLVIIIPTVVLAPSCPSQAICRHSDDYKVWINLFQVNSSHDIIQNTR